MLISILLYVMGVTLRNTALDGAESLAGLDSVAAKGIKKGQKPLPENVPVTPGYIVVLGDKLRKIVREGKF